MIYTKQYQVLQGVAQGVDTHTGLRNIILQGIDTNTGVENIVLQG